MRALLLIMMAELVCVVILATGVGLTFGLGPALMAGGLCGVLACEWLGAKVARPKKRGERS